MKQRVRDLRKTWGAPVMCLRRFQIWYNLVYPSSRKLGYKMSHPPKTENTRK